MMQVGTRHNHGVLIRGKQRELWLQGRREPEMAEAVMAVAWPQARWAVSEAEERGTDSILELRERIALLRP